VAKKGEPFRFGIKPDPPSVADFAALGGFEVVEVLSPRYTYHSMGMKGNMVFTWARPSVCPSVSVRMPAHQSMICICPYEISAEHSAEISTLPNAPRLQADGFGDASAPYLEQPRAPAPPFLLQLCGAPHAGQLRQAHDGANPGVASIRSVEVRLQLGLPRSLPLAPVICVALNLARLTNPSDNHNNGWKSEVRCLSMNRWTWSRLQASCMDRHTWTQSYLCSSCLPTKLPSRETTSEG
jgi:hypothetical protein